MPITKSDFIRYLECPAFFWFFKKKPEVLGDQELNDFDKELVKNGQEVELWARKLFPIGCVVEGREDMAIVETKEYLDEGKKVIFQATFEGDDLYAMVDILEWSEENKYWIINEVKATSGQEKKKIPHLHDATFQYIVAKMAGLDVGRVNLVELNKEFKKDGEINPWELLEVNDITEEVKKLEEEVRAAFPEMKRIFESDKEPLPCDCLYKSRSNHCPAFKYLHPDVPDYSVHDIVRIGSSPKRLEGLIEAGHYSFEDVPKDFELTDLQRKHVDVEQSKIPMIDNIEIKRSLDQLIYPLYFLDYETYPSPVPKYDGCYPYEQVPFQYSLHVQTEPNGELQHYEYLHTDKESHPMLALADNLTKVIGDEGSIIVWNKKFEGKCHEDIAELMPEYAEIFCGYNNRLFDLMDIFSKQNYLHPDFRGGYSIKDVLPTLVPDMTYKDLNIRDGGMAMNSWKRMMFEVIDQKDKDQIASDLLEYCKLDTLAMVKIFESL